MNGNDLDVQQVKAKKAIRIYCILMRVIWCLAPIDAGITIYWYHSHFTWAIFSGTCCCLGIVSALFFKSATKYFEKAIYAARDERFSRKYNQANPSPIVALCIFRWFLSRDQRDELDLIIQDLKEDKADMIRQKRSKNFIFFVLSWHVARTIFAYIWDGVASIARKLIPLVKYLPK